MSLLYATNIYTEEIQAFTAESPLNAIQKCAKYNSRESIGEALHDMPDFEVVKTTIKGDFIHDKITETESGYYFNGWYVSKKPTILSNGRLHFTLA